MARRELTDEEKKFEQELQLAIAQMKSDYNGCPLFEDREKGSLDDLTGKEMTIKDLFPLNDYHCVVFEEDDAHFYLTGGALKDLCNNYPPKFVIGRVIELQPMVKTRRKKEFRPLKVIA